MSYEKIVQDRIKASSAVAAMLQLAGIKFQANRNIIYIRDLDPFGISRELDKIKENCNIVFSYLLIKSNAEDYGVRILGNRIIPPLRVVALQTYLKKVAWDSNRGSIAEGTFDPSIRNSLIAAFPKNLCVKKDSSVYRLLYQGIYVSIYADKIKFD